MNIALGLGTVVGNNTLFVLNMLCNNSFKFYFYFFLYSSSVPTFMLHILCEYFLKLFNNVVGKDFNLVTGCYPPNDKLTTIAFNVFLLKRGMYQLL